MLTAIVDLTQARPHMRKTARYSVEEMRIFSEGYYTGVIMALRVAEIAVENYRRVTTLLRLESRRRRREGA